MRAHLYVPNPKFEIEPEKKEKQLEDCVIPLLRSSIGLWIEHGAA